MPVRSATKSRNADYPTVGSPSGRSGIVALRKLNCRVARPETSRIVVPILNVSTESFAAITR